MSKRKKPLSVDEKRQRLMTIYYTSKEVFNLKELEKLGSQAGIVLQTVKDINQTLLDDSLVECEKIGSGNFFWSFPSKALVSRKTKVEQLEATAARDATATAALEAEIAELQSERCAEDRPAKMARLDEAQQRHRALTREADELREHDPAVLEELGAMLGMLREGANRWTDNVWQLKSWLVRKKGIEGKKVDQWLELSEDFDYVQ